MKPTFLFRWVLDYFITIKKFLWTRNGGTVTQYMLLKGLWAGCLVQGIGEKSEGMVEVGIGIGRAIW